MSPTSAFFGICMSYPSLLKVPSRVTSVVTKWRSVSETTADASSQNRQKRKHPGKRRESYTITTITIYDIPGCFFTGTSLAKSSNNLETICNYVNVICSWLVILRIISVTSTFTVWETYAANKNLTNLKVIIFPIPLCKLFIVRFSHLHINCLRGLVVNVQDFCFGGRGFEPQLNLL